MATKIFNRAQMSTSTSGTGTITLGSATTGYQSFADAGVVDTDVIHYLITDGTSWEIGTGTYTASGTTLSRTVVESTNSDTAISLSGSAVVSIIAPITQLQTAPEFTGTFSLAGILSPTTLASGSTNNYAPTGIGTATVLRITPNASDSTLTGITTGAAGRLILIINIATSDNLTIAHDDSGSTAANRFHNFGTADFTLTGSDSCWFWYDSTISRWRQLAMLPETSTAAQMEAGTSTITAVTPSVAHRHPSASKAWGKRTGTTTTIGAGYNIGSITDSAVSQIVFNFTTAFSSANYAAIATVEVASTTLSATTLSCISFIRNATPATGSIGVQACEIDVGAATDPTSMHVACFGDQT